MRPELGRLQLLVYRECPCGAWCATDEGAVAPVCAGCGGFFVPAGTAVTDDGPLYYADGGEQRRQRGLGFVALFTLEQGAVSVLETARRFLGLSWEAPNGRGGNEFLRRDEYARNGNRWLGPNEAQVASDAINAARGG